MRIDMVQVPEVPQIPSVPQDTISSGKVDSDKSGNTGSKSQGGDKKFPTPQQPASNTTGELKDAINKVIESLQDNQTSLKFKLNEKTHRVIIQVISDKDNSVIREIPPEKTIEMMASICKLVGLNVDEKV